MELSWGAYSNWPHLVLRDVSGTPRWALEADIGRSRIYVSNIQRLRTQFGPSFFGWSRWSPKEENRAAAELKAKLKEFPGDFLLKEFLRRHADSLRNGVKLYLRFSEDQRQNYQDYVKKFFKKNPVRIDKKQGRPDFFVYELSREKKRVKEALELN